MSNPKLSLGQVRGCALRLGPIAPHIILCEGPEDGLTLRQKHPRASVWVSLGTGAMPHIELPDVIRRVTIAGDNNAPGRPAAETASAAFIEQGRSAERRVGNECVSRCRYSWSPYHSKKNKKHKND